jgi:hypothetical protein
VADVGVGPAPDSASAMAVHVTALSGGKPAARAARKISAALSTLTATSLTSATDCSAGSTRRTVSSCWVLGSPGWLQNGCRGVDSPEVPDDFRPVAYWRVAGHTCTVRRDTSRGGSSCRPRRTARSLPSKPA